MAASANPTPHFQPALFIGVSSVFDPWLKTCPVAAATT
jgi:hypothetical protein